MAMKMKISLTAFVLVCIPCWLRGQSTTEEEFNYLSRGYQIQLESGLDMKKDYRLELLDRTTLPIHNAARSVEFSGLYREGTDKPCAYLVTLGQGDNTLKNYLCIPSYDAPDALWDRAFQEMTERLGKDPDAYAAVFLASLRFAASEGRRGGHSLFDPNMVYMPSDNDEDMGPYASCKDRSLIYRVSPVPGGKGPGRVVLNVIIDRSGKVFSVDQDLMSSTTASADLYGRAKEAALKCRFNGDPNAPIQDACKLTFTFH